MSKESIYQLCRDIDEHHENLVWKDIYHSIKFDENSLVEAYNIFITLHYSFIDDEIKDSHSYNNFYNLCKEIAIVLNENLDYFKQFNFSEMIDFYL